MCNVEGPPIKRGRAEKMSSTDPLPIYLDHNATTPVSDTAWQAMIGCKDVWGNPSSTHPYGQQAKFYVEEAREKVALAVGSDDPNQIIFTSGGTEANNLAILGGIEVARKKDSSRNVVISTMFEHPAVEEVLKHLETKEKMTVIRSTVSSETGTVHPVEFEKLVEANKEKLLFVTIMHAQNEIGSIQPIPELVRIARKHCQDKVIFHTDAAQSLGKVPVDVKEFGVDFLSVCSHKFYGPKGVGALYCKDPQAMVQRIMFGAPHEKGLRPGTENVILVVGMAAALERSVNELEDTMKHVKECRDTLYNDLVLHLAKKKMVVRVNGSLDSALPNTLNIAVYHTPTNTYISANRLIHEIQKTVCISAGSACHSTNPGEPIVVSQALQAVGCDVQRALGTMRLSTGHASTVGDMRRAARLIAQKASHQIPEIL